jgi:aldehyde:ferredoxin oxidoreductase
LKRRPDADGIYLDEPKFLKTLDEYYRLRNWDAATGCPKREILEKLGLKDVATELDNSGLLP